MKKLIRNTVVALAAMLSLTTIAQAQTFGVGVKPISWAYEATVAAGAIIPSPIHNTAGLSRLTIVCDNSLNGSTTGTLTIKFYKSDGATLAGTFAVTCANSGTNGGYTFVQVASDQPGVTTTGLVQIPVDPAPFMSVSLAAAGAVSRAVYVWGR